MVIACTALPEDPRLIPSTHNRQFTVCNFNSREMSYLCPLKETAHTHTVHINSYGHIHTTNKTLSFKFKLRGSKSSRGVDTVFPQHVLKCQVLSSYLQP